MAIEINTPSMEALLAENALLREEVRVARKASEITASLVVEQFVKMEEILRRLEENITTEQELRGSLARQNDYLAALHETTLGVMRRLDLSELLEALMTRAAQLQGTPHGFIYLGDPGSEEIELKVGVGDFRQRIGTMLRPGEGVAGKVWQQGRPLVVHDYSKWSGASQKFKYDDIRAVMGAPLKYGREVVGVIGIASDRESDRTFGEDEVELLSRFAQLASIALDNARLHSAIEEAKEKVEGKLEIANTVLTSVRKVIEEVLGGSRLDVSFAWLVPHMMKEDFKKGEFLFHKGERSDKMFFIKNGSVRLLEINKIMGEGNIFGETGILSPLKERTMSIVCEEDSEIYVLDEKKATELFYENPSLVFELIELSINRSLENLKFTVAEKERIESDLRIARDIQQSMLPGIFPPFPDRKEFEIFASMEAAREVGGDFYDFFFIGENKLCFMIGDVSGKGVPAALFMVITKTLLKIEALRGISPGEIFHNVNNMLSHDNEACMFVTVFCGILDTDTGELQICNAGHNPPLLYTDNKEFEFITMHKNLVMGAIENIDFASDEHELKPNDIIFLYTDGVTEAMNPREELFSEERLRLTLSNMKDESVSEITCGVREEINKFAQGALQADDITLMILRFHGK